MIKLRLIPAMLLLWAPLALSSQGRAPISQQTVISQPGSYYLTESFSFSSGYGIDIQANDVTIDLDGHTITAPNTAGIVGIRAVGYDRITIHDGGISGTYYPIYLDRSGGSKGQFKVEGMRVSGAGRDGIYITGTGGAGGLVTVTVINNVVDDPVFEGISLTFAGGTVAHNTVSQARNGINLSACYDATVLDNVVRESDGGATTAGINMGSANCIIANNLVADGLSDGILLISSRGNTLRENNVSRNAGDGIVLQKSTHNEIVGNTTTENDTGIHLRTDSSHNFRNSLRANLSADNTSYGIKIDIGSATNIYRDNNLPGNGSGNSFNLPNNYTGLGNNDATGTGNF